MPVIGYLGTRASGDDPHLLAAFRRGLKEADYIEGQNVAIEYRFAENQIIAAGVLPVIIDVVTDRAIEALAPVLL